MISRQRKDSPRSSPLLRPGSLDQPGLIWFMSRGNDVYVPLVPVDELPREIELKGVPRQVNKDNLKKTGLQWANFLGEVMGTGSTLSLDASSAVFNSRTESNSLRSSPNIGATLDSTFAAHFTPSSPLVQIDTPSAAQEISPTMRPPPPSGSEPDLSKKTYCSHWIRTGECDFIQQGCRYKHEMPSRDILAGIGFRTLPRWWQERTAKSKPAQMTPNSTSSEDVIDSDASSDTNVRCGNPEGLARFSIGQSKSMYLNPQFMERKQTGPRPRRTRRVAGKAETPPTDRLPVLGAHLERTSCKPAENRSDGSKSQPVSVIDEDLLIFDSPVLTPATPGTPFNSPIQAAPKPTTRSNNTPAASQSQGHETRIAGPQCEATGTHDAGNQDRNAIPASERAVPSTQRLKRVNVRAKRHARLVRRPRRCHKPRVDAEI